MTLFPLPTLSPPTPLLKAKAAFSFAIHTSVQHAETEGDFSRQDPKTSLITYLLVGCRRRAVLYSWKDGEPQEVKVRVWSLQSGIAADGIVGSSTTPFCAYNCFHQQRYGLFRLLADGVRHVLYPHDDCCGYCYSTAYHWIQHDDERHHWPDGLHDARAGSEG